MLCANLHEKQILPNFRFEAALQYHHLSTYYYNNGFHVINAMDRLVLVSLSTGMLSFHQRYSAPDDTDIDELQLASYLSALYHVKEETNLDVCNIDTKISLFQQVMKFSVFRSK